MDNQLWTAKNVSSFYQGGQLAHVHFLNSWIANALEAYNVNTLTFSLFIFSHGIFNAADRDANTHRQADRPDEHFNPGVFFGV